MSQEDLTINGYYTKFKGLWDELSTIGPILVVIN